MKKIDKEDKEALIFISIIIIIIVFGLFLV